MIALAAGRRLPLAQVRTLAVNAHNAAAYKEAEDYYRAILRALPADAWAMNYLGAILHVQGQNGPAKEVLEKAVRLAPQNLEAWVTLANAVLALGDLGACASILKQGLARIPDATQLSLGLANVLKAQGQAREAFEILTEAASRKPDEPGLLEVWGGAFLQNVLPVYDERIDALLPRVLSSPSIWASSYARPVYRFLNAHPVIKEMMARSAAGASDAVSYESQAQALSGVSSLIKMMELSSAVDANHEIFFTELRRQQLDQLTQAQSDDAPPLAFSIALAQFCFNNDYVFFETPQEKVQIARLKETIESSVAAGRIDWRRIVCFCSYRALMELGVAAQIAQAPLAESLDGLLNQQHREPALEAQIRPTIAKLLPIEDSVSQKVQGMYESSPYPRWTKPCIVNPVASVSQALAVDGLAGHAQGLHQDRAINEQTRVLIAGCGSGQHSMFCGGRYRPARVTAVDLSLSSLAYATRKTRECGLANVDFLHGDLLDVGRLGERFDVIESVGVLHHMKDPMRGWKALVDVLKPGGVMKIGLYSRRARATVFELRDRYVKEGVIPGPDEVRAIRRDIIARASEGAANLQQFLTIRDFFSLNEAIDLMFHVQESSYSLVQIAAMIEELDLRFLGLCLPQESFRQIFLAEQGAQADLTSLLQWDQFEERHPDAFIGMFTFWVAKPMEALEG